MRSAATGNPKLEMTKRVVQLFLCREACAPLKGAHQKFSVYSVRTESRYWISKLLIKLTRNVASSSVGRRTTFVPCRTTRLTGSFPLSAIAVRSIVSTRGSGGRSALCIGPERAVFGALAKRAS